MKKFCFLFFILFAIAYLEQANAQNTSNKGKDFWVAYTGHIDGLSSRLTLFLSADQKTDYEIYIGNTLVRSSSTDPLGQILANSCRPIIIDPNQIPVYIGSSDDDVNELNKAIRVITTKPISLYSVISYSARTGGTMVLPANTLGKEYYTYSFQNKGNSSGFAEFTIIATEDDTNIEITPTATERNNAHQSGVTFQIKLKKGQIYQYQSANAKDLTGSHVKSIDGCKPIAVFSGNTWAAFCEEGNNVTPSGGDNLYQQLFPISSWGKKFVTAPLFNTLHGNKEVLRVIIGEDNTTLTVNGTVITANGTSLLPKGKVYSFSSNTANIIVADKVISVAQYQTSQTCNPNNSPTNVNVYVYPGDPEITVLNPVEQTLNNITVYSKLEKVPTGIDKYYINVIIKTTDISSFRLDGNTVVGFVPIDQEYSYITIDVTAMQPQHQLTANGGFSAIAYGYGRVESYAYLAGANIQDFTFRPTSAVTGQPITSGCLGETIKLKINLPYLATNLKWEIQEQPILDGSPNAALINGPFNGANGIVYYSYEYPNTIQYNVAGDYTFKVTATKPATDNCGNKEELIVGFTVDNEPLAQFTVQETGCQNAEIKFSDNSDSRSSVRMISEYNWDFGDGKGSNLKDPIHTYQDPGTYLVTLTVATSTGCSKTSETTSITINPKPEAKFTAPTDFCVNKDIVITNLSNIGNGGSIVKYSWDFGDAVPIYTSSAVPPTFRYTTPGLKTIKLTVTSEKDCVSSVFEQKINIVSLPNVDFETPGYCINDGLAKFKNFTKDHDGTTANLKFQWDYGDGTVPLAPSTNNYDGEHTYTLPGSYDVTLKVFNQFGCEAEAKTIRFIVNPFVKAADFTVQNEFDLCSGNDVIINNTSTITAPGTILKIEVYKDFINDPTSFVTILNPQSENILLSYPKFGGNSDKTYTIKLVAYSGLSKDCSKEITKTINIKPSPILEFNAIPAVCRNVAEVIHVNLANETSGILGNGIYTGTGIMDATTALFNPRIAGKGVHTITYTFTTTRGCPATIEQTIEVFQEPAIDAESDIYILAGGEKQIEATASGTGLSYEWSPSIGLSRTDVLNPIAKPDFDTKYTLTVTSSQGCYTSDDVVVHVLQNVNAPNTFTPNGDGVNDVWNIKYLDTYPNSTVEVFNRNGQRVYLSNKGYSNPFDGNYQNKPLPIGTYYYIINPNSGRKSITGNLTIIR